MVDAILTAPKVFLDAAYAIDLVAPNDGLHEFASTLADQMKALRTTFVTTRPVLIEVGNALSKVRHRSVALQLLNSIEADSGVEIVGLSDDLYLRALQLFAQRPDKDWGLTDRVSFIVMRDYGLTDALTTDAHFEQAGFRALMRGDQ
jgi:hypothetical protein